MSKTLRLSLAELKELLATYVANNKIAQGFSATYNIAGLLDTIGKIYTIEQAFTDKMAEFDGEFLSFGKTVEEWAIDLCLPVNPDDKEDVDTVKSYYPNYAPVKFSYDLGDKVFPITRKYNELNKGVHNEGQLTELIIGIDRALANSVLVFRYGAKRQLLGRFADVAIKCMSDTDATLWVANTSQSDIGKKFKNASTGTKWAVLVKAYDSTANKDYAGAIADGYLVEYDTVCEIAKPTDTTKGEAFLKQIKKDIEIATDVNSGHSINGNTLGANGGMTLFVKQGIIPDLEVETFAGAFHREDLAVPCKIIVLPDFGKMTDTDAYAVLIDNRAIRLFPTFEYNAQQENGLKGFMSYFRHFDATCHYSSNAFVKVYKDVSE